MTGSGRQDNDQCRDTLLEKKDDIEAAAVLIGLCSSFTDCASCDVCAANIERWLKKEEEK